MSPFYTQKAAARLKYVTVAPPSLLPRSLLCLIPRSPPDRKLEIHLWTNTTVPGKISQSIGITLYIGISKYLKYPSKKTWWIPPAPFSPQSFRPFFKKNSLLLKHMKHQMFNESLEWKLKMKIKETWGGNRHTKERRKYHRNYNIYREITEYITP